MKKIIFIILTLCLITSCSNEEKDWQDAIKINSIKNYILFLRNYPNSEFCQEAAFKIASLSNTYISFYDFILGYPNSKYNDICKIKIDSFLLSERLESLRDVKRIKLDIRQNGFQNKDLISILNSWFELNHFQIVKDNETYDALIKIDINYKPSEYYYSFFSETYGSPYYTGVKTICNIKIETHNSVVYQDIVSCEILPSDNISMEGASRYNDISPICNESLFAFDFDTVKRILPSVIYSFTKPFGENIIFIPIIECKSNKEIDWYNKTKDLRNFLIPTIHIFKDSITTNYLSIVSSRNIINRWILFERRYFKESLQPSFLPCLLENSFDTLKFLDDRFLGKRSFQDLAFAKTDGPCDFVRIMNDYVEFREVYIKERGWAERGTFGNDIDDKDLTNFSVWNKWWTKNKMKVMRECNCN